MARLDFEWFLPRFDEGWNASSRAIFSTVLPSSLAFSLPFSRDSFPPTAVSLRATFSNLARPNFLEILAFGVFRSRASWPKGNRATMKNFNNPAPGLSSPFPLPFAQGRDNCARFHGKIDNHSGIGNTKIHPRSL